MVYVIEKEGKHFHRGMPASYNKRQRAHRRRKKKVISFHPIES